MNPRIVIFFWCNRFLPISAFNRERNRRYFYIDKTSVEASRSTIAATNWDCRQPVVVIGGFRSRWFHQWAFACSLVAEKRKLIVSVHGGPHWKVVLLSPFRGKVTANSVVASDGFPHMGCGFMSFRSRSKNDESGVGGSLERCPPSIGSPDEFCPDFSFISETLD